VQQDSDFLQQLSARFAQMQDQIRERDTQIHILRSDGAGDAPVTRYGSMEHDTVPVDLTSDLVVGAERYPYPTDVQQNERAVWRNKMLAKYLESIGVAHRPTKTTIITDWFKKYWFGDSVHGEKRLREAGFTREQLVNLTTHHIVPEDLGGPDCIYNYHLMLRGVNSHFGSLFTKESIAWVGTEHAHVAKAVSKFVKRQTADGVSIKKFDPYALSCPTKAVGKRRVVIHDDVVAQSSSQRQRIGVVLEVNLFAAASPIARIEDVTSSVPTSTMDLNVTSSVPTSTMDSNVPELGDVMQREALVPVQCKPFKWRLDWFKPDHYIRFDLKDKYVDTGDVCFVACASSGAARTANSKYLGEKTINATAFEHEFDPSALKQIIWGGKRGKRRVLPIGAMKSILSKMKSPSAKKLFPDFQKLVDDMTNDRFVHEPVEETAIILSTVSTTVATEAGIKTPDA